MPAALISFAIVIALVLGLGAGAALTLGGSVTAVLVEGHDARPVRIVAGSLAIFGLLLFVASMTAAVSVAPLA